MGFLEHVCIVWVIGIVAPALIEDESIYPLCWLVFPIGCHGNSAPSEHPRQFLGLPVAGRWYYCPQGCGSEYCTYLLWYYRKLDMTKPGLWKCYCTHTHTHNTHTIDSDMHVFLWITSAVFLSHCLYTHRICQLQPCATTVCCCPSSCLSLEPSLWSTGLDSNSSSTIEEERPACFLYTSSSAHWAPEVLSAL
jgi:hypothetical protein